MDCHNMSTFAVYRHTMVILLRLRQMNPFSTAFQQPQNILNRIPTTTASVVRIQSVSINIPPLPMSLYEFVLQRSNAQSHAANLSTDHRNSTSVVHQDDNINNNSMSDTTTTAIEWETISPTWTIYGGIAGYQTFTFPAPGVDLTYLRLLCISNQNPAPTEFYSIRFD